MIAPVAVSSNVEPAPAPPTSLAPDDAVITADIDPGESAGARLGLIAFFVAVLNYAFSFLLIWFLPAADYAATATLLVMLIAVAGVASAGVPWTVCRELVGAVGAGDPGRARHAVGFAAAAGGIEALAGAAFMAAVGARIGGPVLAAAAAIAGTVVVGAAVGVGILQGRNRLHTIGTARVAEVIVKIGVAVGLVAAGAGAPGVLIGVSAGTAVVAATGLAYAGPAGNLRRALADRTLWADTGAMIVIQSLVGALVMTATVVATFGTLTATERGALQAALTLARGPLILSVALSVVLFRRIAAARHGDDRVRSVRAVARVYAAVAIPAAVVVASAPPAVLGHVVPVGYRTILTNILPWVAAAGVALGGVNLLTTIAQAEQRTRRVSGILAAAVAADLIGSTFAGRTDGLRGVVAFDCAMVMVLAIVLVAQWRRTHGAATLSTIRAVTTPLILTLPLWAVHDITPVWCGGAVVVMAVTARHLIRAARPRRADARPHLLHLAFEDIRQPESGGGAVRTFEIDRRLARIWDVTVLTRRYPGARRRTEDGITVVPIGLGGGRAISVISYFLMLPLVVWAFPGDVVVEDFAAPMSSALVPLFTGRPVVALCQWLFAREKATQYHLPFHWIEAAGIRLHRRFIVTSPDIAADVLAVNPRASVDVIGNGVTPVAQHPVPEAERRDIVFVGRLDVEHKGLDVLINAFAAVAASATDDLVIAGDGPGRARVAELIERSGVGGRIHCIGRIEGDAKTRLLRLARVVCMPSRYESFGIVALEAQAAGTAVVATDIPSLRDVVPAACGVRVPAGDARALAHALRALIENPGERATMGAAGIVHASTFNWDTLAARQGAVLDDVRASAGRRETTPDGPGATRSLTDVVRQARGRHNRPRRVVIIGNYGNGNTGDDAILEQLLAAVPPSDDVTVLSRSPGSLHLSRGTAVGMLSARAVWCTLRAHALFIGGGGMFGRGIPPLPSLLPAVGLALRCRGTRVSLVAVGIYPDTPRPVLASLRLLARFCSVVAVRDAGSAAVIRGRRLGRTIRPVVVTDPASALTASPRGVARRLLSESGVHSEDLLVISLKPTPDGATRDRVVAEIAGVCNRWTEHGEVVLIAMSARGDYGLGEVVTDTTMSHSVRNRATDPERLHVVGPHLRPADARAVIGCARAVIAMRLHAQIFAAGENVPLLGITFETKTATFLHESGAAVVDATSLTADGVCAWLDEACG